MSVAVVGMSHRTAPIEVRERFHLVGDRVREVVSGLVADRAVGECVLLSTCNRTELYFAAADADEGERAVVKALARAGALSPEETRGYIYLHEGAACVRHLYRVVAGLDSLVLGEPQIQGQVAEAYRAAVELAPESVGPFLHRLFQSAQATGGKVRGGTRISEGSASVPSAAVELASKVFGSLEGRRALVVGAGKMGRITLQCLRDAGVEGVFVASRTLERAARASRRAGGEPVAFEEVWRRLPELDVVVTSTAAPHPILTADRLRRARPGSRPLVILDIALPRDVEPAVGDLQNVFLYNIDDLQRAVEAAHERRAAEMPAAEAIVWDHVRRYLRWYRSREAVPLIKAVRQRAERIRREELDAVLDGIESLSQLERQRIHMASRSALNKILHGPTTALRGLARESEGENLLEAARRLFQLDGREGEEDDEGSER